MTWATVFIVILIAIAATALLSVLAFAAGYSMASRRRGVLPRSIASIGKTVAGVNDGKLYNWSITYDHDGAGPCNTTRFGCGYSLAHVVDLVTSRAKAWGCDITRIEIERTDVAELRARQREAKRQEEEE